MKYRKWIYFVAAITGLVVLGYVFSSRTSYSEANLLLAGDNRSELEKVINHYTTLGDTLKLKAAWFLIEHMDAHFSYQSAVIDSFYAEMERVFSLPGTYNRQFYTERYNQVFKKWGPLMTYDQKKIPDLYVITSDFLIRNIDAAFKMWQTNWGQHFSFEHFCKYILPYRASHEPLSEWRKLYMETFHSLMIDSCAQSNCTFIYGMLDKLNYGYTFHLYFPRYFMPEYSLITLLNMKSASCRDYSNFGLARMRSLGIPVAIDFVPQWGNRSMGHEWNVFIPQEGIAIPFGPAEPIGQHLYRTSDRVITKVYRKTYEKQAEALYNFLDGRDCPNLFSTPCIRDVTQEYIKTADVSVAVNGNSEENIAYIAAFDNKNWQIVDWGKVRGQKANFKNLGRNCVYLPVWYKKGSVAPAGIPFLLTQDGKQHVLSPDLSQKQRLYLTRKYTDSKRLHQYAELVKGGRFQVANKPDFSDSLTIYAIREVPECRFQSVNPDYDGEYAYFRYLAPDGSRGSMAEIEMYDAGDQKLELQEILGKRHSRPGGEIENLFDGNVLTFCDSHELRNLWIGGRFRQPVHISRLRYLPRNDDNFIRENERYELFYWHKGTWQSLRQQIGTSSGVLIYDNAPVNALFLLHNHTKGTEERIFTYENDRQIWW